MGYAIIYSTGTRTNTHYNLQLGGETAIMVKDRFVSAYGGAASTRSRVGGSGGAIQQYVYGQNHPGLLDAGDPAVLVPRHGHADDPRRRLRAARALARLEGARRARSRPGATWVNRTLIEGLNASAAIAEPVRAADAVHADAGLDECINGWRGLSPLALNPYSARRPGYDPAVDGPVGVDALGRPA